MKSINDLLLLRGEQKFVLDADGCYFLEADFMETYGLPNQSLEEARGHAKKVSVHRHKMAGKVCPNTFDVVVVEVLEVTLGDDRLYVNGSLPLKAYNYNPAVVGF